MAELALRAFATPGIPPVPRITSDSFATPVIVHRQLEEGVATSHFSDAGARLTGNTPIQSGNTAIILGDSYVVAEQVEDDQTMGAGLERLARENGVPLDVRQYGWSGASPAQYLYVAPSIRGHWKPPENDRLSLIPLLRLNLRLHPSRKLPHPRTPRRLSR